MRLSITQKKRRKKMENKINIAEILRDCPKGTKLYSPLYGKCNLDEISISDGQTYPIILASGSTLVRFTENGYYIEGFEDTECLLFPSSKIRSWDKFFKRGDVVFNEHSRMVAVFDGWASGEYTEFNTTIILYKKSNDWGEEEVCSTEWFTKATDEERAEFIAAAEKHYGGKYNPETLQVEPAKVAEPKCPFEPFQKVLVRDEEDEDWKADYFSHYEEDDKIAPYVCVGSYYRFCIPYEGSEHLLGTGKPF